MVVICDLVLDNLCAELTGRLNFVDCGFGGWLMYIYSVISKLGLIGTFFSIGGKNLKSVRIF